MKPDYTDFLVEAGKQLSYIKNLEDLFRITADITSSAIKPDLCCIYRYPEKSPGKSPELILKRGYGTPPAEFDHESELITFMEDSGELVCLSSRKESPFRDLLLIEGMQSGMAVPLFTESEKFGILFVNSIRTFYFKEAEITYLEKLSSISVSHLYRVTGTQDNFNEHIKYPE